MTEGTEIEPQKTQGVDQCKDFSGTDDLYFDFKTSLLRPNTAEQLKSIAKWMLANPSATLVIEGYGDENESSEYNLALADSRAMSAKDYLVNLGIAPSRLKTVSFGEEKPFAPGSGAQTRGAHVAVEDMGKGLPARTAFSWVDLYSLNDEKPGYATYSYVLTGQSAKNPDLPSRYLKLIEAVKGQNTPDSLVPSTRRRFYNLFLIPSGKKPYPADNEPNYGLSKLLLDNISIKLSKALLDGPYIITLYKPVGEGNPNAIADIFYVDLTRVHPAVFPLFVRVYKSHVSSEEIHGIEKLFSLKAELLNLMLITEECTGFAKVAYAELQRSFSQAGRVK